MHGVVWARKLFLLIPLSLDQLYLMSRRDVCTDLENNLISLSTEIGNSFDNHLMTAHNVPGRVPALKEDYSVE